MFPKVEVTFEDGFSKVETTVALIGCGDRLKALSASERDKALAALRSGIRDGDVIPGSAATTEKYRAQLVSRINKALGSEVVGDILFLGTSYVDLGEKVE